MKKINIFSFLALSASVVFIGSAFLAVEVHAASFWYVSPSGSASNSGAYTNTWSLQYALDGAGGKVAPGDTIWLRGGVYSGNYVGNLRGTGANPIKVRQYPGETAVLSSTTGTPLTIRGSYAWYWGFEVEDPSVSVGARIDNGISADDPDVAANMTDIRLINVVVHDVSGQGISFRNNKGEVYGALSFYNGRRNDGASGYGIYSHSQTRAGGSMTLQDNMFFNNFAPQGWQINHSGSNRTYYDNLNISNNVVFSRTTANPKMVIGTWQSGGHEITDSTINENYTYAIEQFKIGHETIGIRNSTISGNVVALRDGGSVSIYLPAATTVAGNRFYGGSSGGVSATFPTNTYYTSRPSGQWIYVRANKYADIYDSRRGNIIVYNWSNSDSANVDLSSVLSAGDVYEIRDAQNYFATTPIKSGTYTGGFVSIRLPGIGDPITPIKSFPSGSSLNSATHTPSEFNAFIVKKINISKPDGGALTPDSPVVPAIPVSRTLNVSKSGSGTIVSTPSGINCGSVCSYQFNDATSVTLTASPSAGYTFAGWSSACSGTGGCVVSVSQTLSVSANFVPVTPPPAVPAGGSHRQYFEAESSSLISPMSVGVNTAARNGNFVSSASANSGKATFNFNVPASGVYYIWGRVLAPSGVSDSFFVSIDGGQEDIYDAAEGTWSQNWQWTKLNGRGGTGSPLTLNPRAVNFTVGSHQIIFRVREADSKLDAIFITNESAAFPEDVTVPNLPVCPQIVSPAPDFCPGGVVTSSYDENRCVTSYNCVPSAPVTRSLHVSKSGNGVVTSSPAGIDCGNTCSVVLNQGTGVVLTASPSGGYVFSGWGGACSGTSSCRVALTDNSTVTAIFTAIPVAQLRTLTVSKSGSGTITSSPSGINCGSTCSYQFNNGVSITLTASPSGGYTFAGWSGACSGTGGCVLALNSDRAVTASFLPVVVPPTPNTPPAGANSSPQGFLLELEAEQAGISFPASVYQDATAGAGQYAASATSNSGTITFSFDIPKAGYYFVWGKIKSPDYIKDSFFVVADGGGEDVYDTAENLWSPQWQWTRVTGRRDSGGAPSRYNSKARMFFFSAGRHTLKFRARESGTALDKILITGSSDYIPGKTDAGAVLPSDSIIVPGSRPDGSVISGMVQVGDTVEVRIAELNVRNAPSLSGSVINKVNTGKKGIVLEGPVGRDGYDWYRINYGGSLVGWSGGGLNGKVYLQKIIPTVMSAAAGKLYIYLEAEDAVIAPPSGIIADVSARNGKYVSSPVPNSGSMTFSFNVLDAGTYYVWGRVLAPVSSADSFNVSVDVGASDVYDAAESTWSSQWQWTKLNGRTDVGNPLTLNPRVFNLSVGLHQIMFKTREANSKIDSIFITNDPTAVPV